MLALSPAQALDRRSGKPQGVPMQTLSIASVVMLTATNVPEPVKAKPIIRTEGTASRLELQIEPTGTPVAPAEYRGVLPILVVYN